MRVKFFVSGLCEITGLHRNTLYNLLRRGVIHPVEVISGINIYSDETVDDIKKYYETKLNNKFSKLVANDTVINS